MTSNPHPSWVTSSAPSTNGGNDNETHKGETHSSLPRRKSARFVSATSSDHNGVHDVGIPERAKPVPALPRWARIVRQIPSPKLYVDKYGIQHLSPDQIDEEDFYLRTEAYHSISRRMDRVADLSMEECCRGKGGEGLLKDVVEFLCMFQSCKGSELANDCFEGEGTNQKRKGGVPPENGGSDEGGGKRRKIGGEVERGSAEPDLSACRQATSTPVGISFDQMIPDQPKRYPPTILPLAMISVDMKCLLDRRAVANHLYRRMRRKEEGVEPTLWNPAVCLIQNSVSYGGEGRSHGELMEEIVRQCVSQESPKDRELYERHLLAKHKLHRSRRWSNSYTNTLLAWANHTMKFNSVVVIVENLESIPQHTLDAFMATMTSLRADDGLPISIVLLRIRHVDEAKLSNLANDSLGGHAGVLVKTFHVRSSWELLDRTMDNLYVKLNPKTNLPVIISGYLLRRMREAFANVHRSAIVALTSMKLALACHFATPGSFLCAVNCADFINKNWDRAAWFCLDPAARSRILSDLKEVGVAGAGSPNVKQFLQSMDEYTLSFSFRNRMIRILNERLRSACPSELPVPCEIDEVLTKAYTVREAFKSALGFLLNSSRKDVMAVLREWKKELEVFHCGWEPSKNVSECSLFHQCVVDESEAARRGIIGDWKDCLHEQIVLVGESLADDVCATIQKELVMCITERIHEMFIVDTVSHREKLTHPSNFFLARRNNKLCEGAILAEPRRAVAAALTGRIPSGTIVTDHSSGKAFNLFEKRIITILEWFQLFSENLDHSDMSELSKLQVFGFSIYELVQCGLVRRMPHHRLGDSVEKTALVWSTGA